VVLAAPAERVAPGSSSESVVLVRNTGTERDVFDVLVQGAAAAWASVEPQVVELDPDEEAPVWLRFHPPRSAATAPGPTSFEVAVVSRHDPSFVGFEGGAIDVDTYTDVSVAAAGDPTVAHRTITVPVTLANAGNAPARVTVCVRGDDREPLAVDVAAGERATVELLSTTRKRRAGDRLVVDVLPADGVAGTSLEVRVPEPPSTLRRDLTRSAAVLTVVVAAALVLALTALQGKEGSPERQGVDVTLAPGAGTASTTVDGNDTTPTSSNVASPTSTVRAAAAAGAPPADLPTIAFVRVYGPDDRDIVVRPAGARSQETRLRNPGATESQPVLSPDGSRIAYVRERGGEWNVCVIAAGGGDAACGPAVGTASSVGWRPDGRSLVVSRDGGLYEVAFDPTTSVLGDARDLSVDVPSGRFSLSPEGERVVFSDGRRITVRPLSGGDGLVVRVPGSPDDPRWSQDGARILYTSDYQIYSAPVGDGPVRQLTGRGSVNGDATSAGTWVVFRSNRTGQGDLYAVRADAKDGDEAGIARITSTAERDVEPSA
jgi:hypothetical protein